MQVMRAFVNCHSKDPTCQKIILLATVVFRLVSTQLVLRLAVCADDQWVEFPSFVRDFMCMRKCIVINYASLSNLEKV